MSGDSLKLAGKTAVVTGAGRGIGRCAALTMAGEGAAVVLASRTGEELNAVAEEITTAGGQALAHPTDVTDRAAVDSLMDAALDRFGRIDVLVNNSGVISSLPLLELEPDEWDRVVDTNLRGVYLCTRAAGRHLVEQGAGKVINIASNFAGKGVPNHAAYCSSKAAVVAFTKAMAVEWARHGVQVNALAPGYFSTELNADLRADEELLSRVIKAIPARRMGEPDELGPWLSLLASSASDFMTGETIVIDGGQAIR